jgi:hypothetical protein
VQNGQTYEGKHTIQWESWVDSERKHQDMVMFYFTNLAHTVASGRQRHVKRRLD